MKNRMKMKMVFALLVGGFMMVGCGGGGGGGDSTSTVVDGGTDDTPSTGLPDREVQPLPSGETITTLDVLFVYSPEVEAAYNGEVNVVAQQFVDYANLIHSYSGTGVVYRVSAVVPDTFGALNETIEDSIETIRPVTGNGLADVMDENNADIVFGLLYSASNSVCGLAYVLHNTYDPEYLAGVIDPSCQDSVLAHELGHLMGLTHDEKTDAQYGEVSPTPYGRGYGSNNDFYTVMAYSSSYGSALEEPVFSSPELSCGQDGVPCGVEIGAPSEAFSISIIREKKDLLNVR